MGIVATGGFNALLPLLGDSSPYFEVSWETKLAKGAWPYTAKLKNAAGERVAAVASLASEAGYAPPLKAYLAARAELDAAPLGDEAAVQKVLPLNPADLDALYRAAKQLAQQKKPKEAADAWRSVTKITPLDGAAWAELGKSAYAAESFEEAGTSLSRAAGLGVKDAPTLEIQARLRMRQNDFAGSLAPIEEALTTVPSDQPLWLLRAECARALKQLPKEAESVERAAALGEVPAIWTKDLIGAYLEAGQAGKALVYLRKSQTNLPTDAPGLMEYAAFWERAQQPKEGETLWLKAIATDPNREAGYVGLVANYSAAQRYADAGAVAERGLTLLPKSLPLLLAKEQALEHAGDIYGARRFLTRAADSTSLDLLRRRAALEDVYGGAASDSYLALVKGLTSQNAPQVEIVEAYRRGVMAALREERPDAAKIFAEKLATAGDRSGLDLVTPRSSVSHEQVEIPGGADALEFLLLGHSTGKPHPEQILLTAASLMAKMNPTDEISKAAWQHMAASIHEYFQRIASLNALGQRKAHAYEIVLSLNDKPGKQRTEKVFEILGLKMHRDKEGMSVKSAEGKAQSKKQDVLAALAIDEQAIEEALGSGKTYTLEVPFDFAPVFPSEEFWRSGFYEKEKLPGGLVEAFVTDVRLPRLYSAFNSMDHAAAQAFAHADSPKNLAERYSMGLWLYSAALAMNGNAVEVPGGDAARSIWTNLVGADPNSGVGFFEELLRKDDGRLISFFYTLSQLNMEHQRFFTRSTERTKRFYELFRNSAEMRRGSGIQSVEGGFVKFLREVPLNEDLSVDFPGSPEVWMVAKGLNSKGTSVAKMTRKMKRSAAPDDEDQILIRLASTEYKDIGRAQSELANLIVVARIDAQRTDPLTPESALLLAQGYATHRGLYPYFIRLGDLETADYEKLLSLDSKCEGLDIPTANIRLGELHAFLALAGAVHDSAVHDSAPPLPQFLPLFRKALDRFLAARDGASFAEASLAFVSELIPYVKPAEQSADKAIRNLLLGVAGPSREKAFDQVLSLQKIPSLDGLLSIRHDLQKLTGSPAVFDEMQRELERLAVLDVPKAWHLTEERRKSLNFYDTSQAIRMVGKLRLTASKHKKNEDEELQKLATGLRVEIEPWVELALVGRIYARYLAGSDLLVSEDPMLVRKHTFVSMGPRNGRPDWFQTSGLLISSDAEGSYFVGGLAEFSIAAGKARVGGNHLGGAGGEFLATALVASVRATDWRGFTPSSLSSFGASIRLAREWIVESAAAPEMRVELGNAARGILSLSRRKALLNGVEEHDWNAAWQAVSVSDLHFLGDKLSEHAPQPLWRVTQLQAMKQAAQHTVEADMLGSVAPELSGCAQPRLQRYEPYEEYQRNMLPDPLSQRLAELKINLAWLADNAAWEPERLIRLAEPTADDLVTKLKMRDARDWSGALDAYRGLKADTVEALLNQ
jgi:Tfp pilus assembly protein PilF